ncbi:Pfs NACHT and Ankyrin domain [Fusarium albosuccineum]|uniref:Pfs NACHT and Ankyrin domain n=1 Tax=Fusarium albosuccineum TaxID=1237068 RepID=A0A8H4LQZ2_9HYPO|nr:Pfs NACHT and Ankyrin domain [Fusarium albosuccineum]
MDERKCRCEDGAKTSSRHPQKPQKTHQADLDASERSCNSHCQYTIAWICALHIEVAAARAMLDEIHQALPMDTNDTNTYTLGSIERHNVVIACLPVDQYGTNNAATVLTHLVRTFPEIRLGLMVGIGGGVPDEADVRLGDIVLGTSVIQHDLGKIVEDGLQSHASPRCPPPVLSTAVASLRAQHEGGGSRIPFILRQRFEGQPEYGRPTSPDHLFLPTYNHISQGPSCGECDHSRLVSRERRSTDDPLIHYGRIASGNQVMRSGTQRVKLAAKLGVICFEMEAAGLMDILPCLPIRGICDYADSHKNKEWQRYAAATAAAYAKEFLSVLPVTQVCAQATYVPSSCELFSGFLETCSRLRLACCNTEA